MNIYHEKYVYVVMGSTIILFKVELKGPMCVQYSVYILEFYHSNICKNTNICAIVHPICRLMICAK